MLACRLHDTLYKRKKRKTKYAKTKAEANQLSIQLARVEECTRTGIAPQQEIEQWIGRKWLTDEDADQAFLGYSEAAQRTRILDKRQTEYERILLAYGKYLEENTKVGVSRKNFRTAMGRAMQVVGWLEEEVPDLTGLTVEHVQEYRTHLRSQGYAPWTVFHHLTALRILLDQAIRLGMIHDNPARQISLNQPKKVEERLILNERPKRIVNSPLSSSTIPHGTYFSLPPIS